MRFRTVEIRNFRGITHVLFEDLRSTVVVAGPNGCGKSSILEAIRLWKTVYGPYNKQEMHTWYGENSLQYGHDKLTSILQSKDKPLIIEIEVIFDEKEKSWLTENVDRLLRTRFYRVHIPEFDIEWETYHDVALDDRLRQFESTVNQQVNSTRPKLLEELERNHIIGKMTYEDGKSLALSSSALLSTVFSVFDPSMVGTIAYHRPDRAFGRERLTNLSLSMEQKRHSKWSSTLYGGGQYSNIKSQLAESFLRKLITDASNDGATDSASVDSLEETMKEIFKRFFPAKTFHGVTPTSDGQLKFQVNTPAGVHDINDLSSGEKELIYGYLHLKNTSPSNSVILIDEPELHLNPRLTIGLPDFYHEYIGEKLNNQIWLITHSDSILRQAFLDDRFSVYQMVPASAEQSENQLTNIKNSGDVEKAIIDLVGDIASYAPNAKTVFLEGSGKTQFDKEMIQYLFPKFSENANLIGMGNKRDVRNIHDLIDRAKEAGVITGRYYSITDRDTDSFEKSENMKRFCWDRYHIENYLLDEAYILSAMKRVNLQLAGGLTESAIEEKLRKSASSLVLTMVQEFVEDEVQRELRSALRVRGPRDGSFSPTGLNQRLVESQKNVAAAAESFTEQRIAREFEDRRTVLEASLDDGNWKREFRGRDILKKFVGEYVDASMPYETFRNIVLSEMRDADFQPQGIKEVLEQISAD